MPVTMQISCSLGMMSLIYVSCSFIYLQKIMRIELISLILTSMRMLAQANIIKPLFQNKRLIWAVYLKNYGLTLFISILSSSDMVGENSGRSQLNMMLIKIIIVVRIGRGNFSFLSKSSSMTASIDAGSERLISMIPVAILRPFGPYHLDEAVVIAFATNGYELEIKTLPTVYNSA